MLPWAELRARLHAVPGFGGDQAKGKRKAFIQDALGLKGPPPDLFKAYVSAGPTAQLHVVRCLEELERGS